MSGWWLVGWAIGGGVLAGHLGWRHGFKCGFRAGRAGTVLDDALNIRDVAAAHDLTRRYYEAAGAAYSNQREAMSHKGQEP